MAEWSGRWSMLVASWSDALRDESPRRGRIRSLSRSRSALAPSRSLSRTRAGSVSAEEYPSAPESLKESRTHAPQSGSDVLKPKPRGRSKSPVNLERSESPRVTNTAAERNPVPSAQRLLKLEVENLILRLQTGEAEEDVAPIHVKHLRGVEDDNAWLGSQIFETKSKVERRKLFAEMASVKEGASNEVANTRAEWSKKLHELQVHLNSCTERTTDIQDSMTTRALALHKQLQLCLAQVNEQSPHAVSCADVQEETALEAYRELEDAVGLRNELQELLLEAQKEARNIQEIDTYSINTSGYIASDPQVLQLHDEVYGAKGLERHLDELKRTAVRESQMYGSNRFQSAQQQISSVSDELYQNSQTMSDERVCFESEIQELKNKARVLEDSLDSAKRELYYWREKAEQEQEQASLSPVVGCDNARTLRTDVEKLRAENASLSEELESLQRMEEEQKRTLEDLKTDMEVLYGQASTAFNKSLSMEFKANSSDALC